MVKSLCLFALLVIHVHSTENTFEHYIEPFINECKKEILRVDSSESLENFDKNDANCLTACLYIKLELLSDREFDMEKLREYLIIMVRYMAAYHKIEYKDEYVQFGLDCVPQDQEEEDVCELVSKFEDCWYEKIVDTMKSSRVVEFIMNENE